MSDIGLNPPKAGNVHSRTGIMNDALAQFGSVVIDFGTASHADVATTTTAASLNVAGVVTSQGDPNNSNLFAVGDEASVRDLGDVEILVLPNTAYTRGMQLITTTTAGVAGPRGSATGEMTLIGTVIQDVTTGANPQLISCRLLLQDAKF